MYLGRAILRCLCKAAAGRQHRKSAFVASPWPTECSFRDAELKELKDRSQSVIQRVAQLSAAIQGAQNSAPVAVQFVSAPPEASAAQAPEPIAKGENPAETQAPSEKEQLVKLQERMSAEIERVRAELKERSGRWKVRRSAP